MTAIQYFFIILLVSNNNLTPAVLFRGTSFIKNHIVLMSCKNLNISGWDLAAGKLKKTGVGL